MSQLFKIIKESVTARQAAEAYGLKVNRKGIACCPFHHDKTPSMKLDERYYCFGCGCTGDAVDLTGQLLGISAKEAALRLASDFGITIPDEKTAIRKKAASKIRTKTDIQKDAEKWMERSVRILLNYRELLRYWKEESAPQRMEEEWHPLFCEALKQMDYIEYLMDELMLCSRDQFIEMKKSCGKEIDRIEARIRSALTGGEKETGQRADEECRG